MKTSIHKIGFRAGIIAFAATLAFDIVQTLQLMRVFDYPWDEISIYGFSLAIVIPFLVEMLALHHVTTDDKKFWSLGALLFTVMYVVFVTANYVVQLTTVIPMTLKGEVAKIDVLVQYPHSLFWDFDAIGYIFMGFATAFAAPLFSNVGFEKWVRTIFLVHGFVTTPMIAFVYFYWGFSELILLIGIPWAITAPLFMLMLALWFKRGEGGKIQIKVR
jgi:hypothetical protein